MIKHIKSFEELRPGDLIMHGAYNQDAISSFELCIRKFISDDPVRDVVLKNGCFIACYESMLTLNFEGNYMLVDETYFNNSATCKIFIVSRL